MEHWQLAQLERLAQLDPERVETMLNTLWRSYPGLLEELATQALDREEITLERYASTLGLSAEEAEAKLHAYRNAGFRLETAVVHSQNIARLAKGQVAVWEVVREYRKLGSVEMLKQAFPSLSESELAAALRYAERNYEEIQAQIDGYESMLARRRAEYPFAK
jgi:uncharacterized protein (DUF433 family)